jgi:hypothetical protein
MFEAGAPETAFDQAAEFAAYGDCNAWAQEVGREFAAGTGAGVGLKGCGGASEAAKGARAVAVLKQGHAGRRLADRGAACEKRRGVGGLPQSDGRDRDRHDS